MFYAFYLKLNAEVFIFVSLIEKDGGNRPYEILATSACMVLNPARRGKDDSKYDISLNFL